MLDYVKSHSNNIVCRFSTKWYVGEKQAQKVLESIPLKFGYNEQKTIHNFKKST